MRAHTLTPVRLSYTHYIMHNDYCGILLFSHTGTGLCFSIGYEWKQRLKCINMWDGESEEQSKTALMPHSVFKGTGLR